MRGSSSYETVCSDDWRPDRVNGSTGQLLAKGRRPARRRTWSMATHGGGLEVCHPEVSTAWSRWIFVHEPVVGHRELGRVGTQHAGPFGRREATGQTGGL